MGHHRPFTPLSSVGPGRVPRGLDAKQGWRPLFGWNDMRQRLEGVESNPVLVFFDTCLARLCTFYGV
jgi:hypothetical protein